MKYDVVIVGAGPAGLFSAYELIENNKQLKIALLDKGASVKNRVCPMNKKGVPCQNCNPCAILAGYGGAGTFSDGKLNFIPRLGKSDLTKYMSESESYKLIDETEEIFNKFKMDAEIYPSNMDEAMEIKKKVAISGAKLLVIKQKHLGSDHLPEYINGICDYLEEKGVTLIEKADVSDIKTESEDKHFVTYRSGSKEVVLEAKNVIIAPGRTGAKWIQELADKYNIPYLSQSIEIGVRVEVRKEIMEEITNVIYDPTIFIKTDTYGDEIRTFCTNPGGFVAKENYYGYICVNGHALKDIKSNLGDGKPIIQSLRDLKKGRRSEWKRINKGFIEPTLKDCVAGDLALVMPHRIIVNILEGLEKLDKIIPGVNNDDTLLYGPEIKFFSNEIETDDKFRLKNANLYFVGDGSGKAGNIVTAAATGLVAARDILERTK